MKGLLIKDIKLMKNMKTALLPIVVVAAAMAGYGQNTSFIIIYLALIGATFANSTLSYDEFDNGYAFLFSLPVTKKNYVAEKYCFGLLLCGGGWLLGSIICAVSGIARNTIPLSESLLTSLAMLPAAMILLSVLLPFHLKFGGEKGKIVLIAVIGGFCALYVIGLKLLQFLKLDPDFILETRPAMGIELTAAGTIAVAAVILLLSLRISMGIMEKKEF